MSMRLTLFSYHFCFTKRITSVSPSFSVVFFAFILYNESMRKGGKYLWQQKFLSTAQDTRRQVGKKQFDGQIHLCGLSLGGVLDLNYALDFPQKVKTLVLIGTPYKVPKAAFAFQNIIFRFLPNSVFETMAFDKKDTFALGNSMKNLDFSDKVKNIKCPALILCGKKDSANIKSAYFLSQNIKGAELKIIENTGHVVNEENPETLANILNEYYLQNKENIQ